MMLHMKQRFLALAIACLLFAPLPSFGQDEAPREDVRLEGYGATNVKLPPQGSALTWFLMLALAGVCIGVMFKNAQRSHLD